jgi:hypothetical protein
VGKIALLPYPRVEMRKAILPTRSTPSCRDRVGKRAQELCPAVSVSDARLPTLRRL